MKAVSFLILVPTILSVTSCMTVRSDRESEVGSSRIHPGVLATVVQPDLSSRPLRITTERQMDIPADVLFKAWTSVDFDRWFATPGTVFMNPEVNSVFFFEVFYNDERHPHYGRILELETNRLVKMTWLTAFGTQGMETVMTMEFIARGAGTLVRLTQEGFPDELSRDRHLEGWIAALELLETSLSTPTETGTSPRTEKIDSYEQSRSIAYTVVDNLDNRLMTTTDDRSGLGQNKHFRASKIGTTMNIDVNVKDRIRKPVNEVFEAIVDAGRMSHYFISSGSGRMKSATTVEWEFADVDAKLSVDVKEIEENRKIIFDWTASGVKARVTITLKAVDSSTTLVTINEAGWPMDHEGMKRALGQTAGWTDFLCCMKAYLQHDINLRLGRTKEDL